MAAWTDVKAEDADAPHTQKTNEAFFFSHYYYYDCECARFQAGNLGHPASLRAEVS